MRNLFDQYNGPENRLTHALAACLDEDRTLLGAFLGWVGVKPPVRATRLLVVEQSLPGDAPEAEVEAERKGLPDVVIHDDETWCLLIESKVQAGLTDDQLARHVRTLQRRGFSRVSRLALTKADARPHKTIARTWSALYEWLGTVAQSEWPDRLRAYLRAAEIRLAREEYLTEGTLTRFDGFQFSDDNPYTYGEGKRLLKLAIAELRKDRALKALGMDPKAAGRSAITGRGGRGVWDFLSLKDRPKRGSFTSYPHLTLGVQAEFIEIAVTIPNGVAGIVRQRLNALGVDGLVALNEQISRRTRRIVGTHGWCGAYALQRHYLSQRSAGIMDARLTFKLETSRRRGRSLVKRRSEWVETFAALLGRKSANIQFGYMVQLWWGDVPELASRQSLQIIVDSWRAMVGLIRFRGHLPKGGYDVPNAREPQRSAPTPAVR